jgi:hypothetical protein
MTLWNATVEVRMIPGRTGYSPILPYHIVEGNVLMGAVTIEGIIHVACCVHCSI